MLLPVKKVSLCREYVISTRVFTMLSIALWLCEARSNTRLAYSRSWNSKPCDGTHSLSGSLMKLRTGMNPPDLSRKLIAATSVAVWLLVTVTQNVTSPCTLERSSMLACKTSISFEIPEGTVNGCGVPLKSIFRTSYCVPLTIPMIDMCNFVGSGSGEPCGSVSPHAPAANIQPSGQFQIISLLSFHAPRRSENNSWSPELTGVGSTHTLPCDIAPQYRCEPPPGFR